MKSWFLAAFMAIAGILITSHVAAEAGDIQASGRAFVELLTQQDFAGAYTRFDATMKRALPADKLRQTWETLQSQAGRFQKQLRSRTEKYGAYQIVFLTCQFEKTPLDVKVVFNTQGQVAGLFFVPSKPAVEVETPPPYADTNRFRERQVRFGSGDWVLPGTLTLPLASPGKRVPAVVLVHGSGPNDRDETIGPNKPFRDLAWGLASKGVAVLRYEKRTKEHGAQLLTAKDLTVKEETIDDAVLAAAELRQTEGVDPARVFVLGHSLGGMVAPRIGLADDHLAGLILLAGATRPLEDLMLEQTRYILSLDGKMSAEAETKLAQLERDVAKVKRLNEHDAAQGTHVLGAPAKYWLDLREYDPAATARRLKLPMLILQGQRDYQVGLADFENWKKALGASANVTFKLYPKLNHLFMAGEGRSKPAEYETPGHVSAEVIHDVASWILDSAAKAK
jgi:alpha-beta hydrolase superfamily lysophospholipase